MVIKNLENKIKLVLIICSLFLLGCIIISISSIWTAKVMVSDAHQKVYVLDGNVPILVQRSTMEETLDVEAKSHVEMFHHYFFTLAPDDKYIKYTMDKAMYLVDETGLAQYNTLKEKGFYKKILSFSLWDVVGAFCVNGNSQGINLLINMFFGVALNAAIPTEVAVLLSILTLSGSEAFHTDIAPSAVIPDAPAIFCPQASSLFP